ncbi:MAG: EAL domain-containing protein [Clostridiales bacterium]|jgi:PAS domain S-box-containing protein|nr:EAL domain-containing protein [Clostridiales bacterium]
MQFVSAGCFELTGYPSESLLHNRDISYNGIIAYEYRDHLWKEWERVLADRSLFKYEYEIITAGGERKWVLERGQGVYNQQGEVEALEGVILDISDLKEMEYDLRFNYEHDTWTGLYNRRYLVDLLKRDRNVLKWGKIALVNINLSTVQSLTLTYGFHYSQELIKNLAHALRFHCSENRILFRVQENQFLFYIKDYEGREELKKFCGDIADTLGSILTAERIGGGIGVFQIEADSKAHIEDLLKNLLIASEAAINNLDKMIGIRFFDRGMETQVTREETIKDELTKAAADKEGNGLFVQYQPILDLRTNKVYGFEALARLKVDNLGLVSPLEFIPVAEKTKLIIPVGERIIIQALNFQKEMMQRGYRDIIVSVNISAIQLFRENFAEFMCGCMSRVGVNPKNVILEITESVFASNYENINVIVDELKNCGVRIALDDFGTGYSSLVRSRDINANYLKIDKSFVDELLSLAEGSITGDIISMAHKMNHNVVAEGIEHEKQKQYLLENGCDLIQGYLISRPLDRDSAFEFLGKHNQIPGYSFS